MGVPRAILALLVLSGAYWIAAKFLDQSPEDRELANPYHLLRHLERDAFLRSSFQNDRATLRRQEQVWLDFDTAARTARSLVSTGGALAEWSTEGLTPEHGSVRLHGGGTDRALFLEVDGPLVSSATSLVLEGRARLPDAAEDGSFVLAICSISPAARTGRWTEARQTQGTSEASLRVSLAPAGPSPRPALVKNDLEAEEWFEFSIGVPGHALPTRPGPVTVCLQIDAGGPVLLDELVLRAAPRLEGLLAGGHARNVGATEGTRDLKRILRRGAEERLCLVLPPPSTLELVVEPERQARLTFGVTSLSPPNPAASTELVVAVSRESRFEETLLRTTLETAHTTRFVDHELDLTRFSGEPIRLQFRVTSARPEQAPILALADPVLDSRRDRSLPHLFWIAYPAELQDQDPEMLARLRDEGLTLTDLKPVSAEPALNWLCAFASHLPPEDTGPRPALVPPRTPTLPQVLTARGYRGYAAVETWRTPGVLQGFPRRWAGQGGPALDSVLAAFDPDRPCFVTLELPHPDGPGILRQLLEELDRHEVLENTLLALVPVSGSGPVFLRLPGGALRNVTFPETVSTVDLAPTLLALLELEPCDSFHGVAFDIETLAGRGEPAGLANTAPVVPLTWSPELPRRREVVLDEALLQWPGATDGAER